QCVEFATAASFGHRSVAYPLSNRGRHDRVDRGGRGMKNDVRCWYSLKPGRPRMYFSVSRAPVAWLLHTTYSERTVPRISAGRHNDLGRCPIPPADCSECDASVTKPAAQAAMTK